MAEAENADRPRMARQEISQGGGQVTPGIDDTPFIQYALEALTREDGLPLSTSLSSTGGSFTGPDPIVAAQLRAAAAPPTVVPVAARYSQQPTTARRSQHLEPAAVITRNQPTHGGVDDNTPSFSSTSTASAPAYMKARSNLYGAHKRIAVPHSDVGPGTRYGNRSAALTSLPTILRLPSFILLTTLCLFMIVALILSAAYSKQHDGLLAYPGTTNSGHYFLFRILPQLVGALILLYAQVMIITTLRILPFERMSRDDPLERHGAIFQRLYPKSFLWPHLVGPMPIKVCIFVTWLLNFTVPLLSTLFGIIYLEGEWIWATVQGVAWTLVVFYIFYLVALGLLAWFWFGRVTGMIWDIRSIADMVPMLHYSNVNHTYYGTQGTVTRDQLEFKLRERAIDRLGYWQFERPSTTAEEDQGGFLWWGIGAAQEHGNIDDYLSEKKKAKFYRADAESAHSSLTQIPRALTPEARYRYLPWCLRNVQMLAFVILGVIILVVLLVLSFHPSTRLTQGFWPRLPARPDRNAFSPANFLYSFIPSLLGLILFLLFQSLDMSFRPLVPWAELSNPEGSPAAKSMLVDYAACLPLQTTFKALGNGHYRMALISFLSTILIFLPILGGGLFMALTVSGTSDVRMFPSIPVFGVTLALLGLLVCGLAAMLPARGAYRMPHAVTSLAEIFTFITNEDITEDAAFRFPRSKTDLLGRLGVGREMDEQSRWHFGTSPGRDETLGVRRLRKFTEKRPTTRRGQSIV
ncbi:hypothetical protein jhhlp_004004 [Lomentospora prolificans]|uniref:Phosphoribosylaminoimidazole-succinocarboxamide synthase n=1 Tax=Lomentospora prolificans TaxID=41688 RepID=A0A2N3NAC9_9PEZI|nr:hypothetical protein jhhlp_004004 [Lomentospora prolificans]